MIDPADLAGLPPPDDGPESPARRRPPNYLAMGERRRLLWRFMPAALVVLLVLTWVERAWLPRDRPPPAAPIDARLEAVRGPRPAADEVIIEPEPEPVPVPVPVNAVAGALGAPASALATVRDDTFFRDADMDAWEQMFVTLREAGSDGVRRARARRVSYSELFGQPQSFRGRLVRLEGTLRRLEKLAAPQNRYGIHHYWQGWLEPAGGPALPIVVQFLQVPEGMPEGLKISEPVVIRGYFLKRYAYAAADTIRVAPLVMALEPVRRAPIPVPAGAGSLVTWTIVSMAALVAAAAVAVGLGLAGRPAVRRGASGPVDLSAALAGHEPFSVADSLRRFGAGAASHAGDGERR